MDERTWLAMRKGGLCDETLDERQKALGSEERLYPMPYHAPCTILHINSEIARMYYTRLHFTSLYRIALSRAALG